MNGKILVVIKEEIKIIEKFVVIFEVGSDNGNDIVLLIEGELVFLLEVSD